MLFYPIFLLQKKSGNLASIRYFVKDFRASRTEKKRSPDPEGPEDRPY